MVQRKQRNERRDQRQRKCACTCKKKKGKRVLDTKRENALRESEIKEGKDSKKNMAVDFAHE